MALEILEKKTINEDDQTNEIRKKKRRIIILKIATIILIIIILLMSYLTFKIGKIGYNYLSIWEIEQINLTEDDFQITRDTKLNIFNTKRINGQKVIAPMQSGSYKFMIRNDSNYNMIYSLKFTDDMTNFVNMKYRLKIDNIYIRGNKKEYVGIGELNVNDIIVPKNSVNIYTLEWNWESDDKKDIYIGTQEDQYYYFKIEIFSNIYDKGVNMN